MRDVEFEIGAGTDNRGDPVSRIERARPLLPWFLLLAAGLIGAGSGLAQQTELPLFAEEDSETHYLSQNADGGVTAWSWRGDQFLDHGTITRVGAALAPSTDVPEWSCLDADEPDAPAAPYPEVAGGILCTGSGCHVDGAAENRSPCTVTQWIPPEGWEWPTDGATSVN